jgi:hypothetical protein
LVSIKIKVPRDARATASDSSCADVSTARLPLRRPLETTRRRPVVDRVERQLNELQRCFLPGADRFDNK